MVVEIFDLMLTPKRDGYVINPKRRVALSLGGRILAT